MLIKDYLPYVTRSEKINHLQFYIKTR